MRIGRRMRRQAAAVLRIPSNADTPLENGCLRARKFAPNFLSIATLRRPRGRMTRREINARLANFRPIALQPLLMAARPVLTPKVSRLEFSTSHTFPNDLRTDGVGRAISVLSRPRKEEQDKGVNEEPMQRGGTSVSSPSKCATVEKESSVN